jgi:hypothetical protein
VSLHLELKLTGVDYPAGIAANSFPLGDGETMQRASEIIAGRHLFHVGGYDPIAVEARYRRFQTELPIFERTCIF